jgi:hypothetical protein
VCTAAVGVWVFVVGIGLGAMAMGEELDVTRFGARPGDGKDDTAAVQAAIDRAAKQPGSRIVFPAGRYEFHAGAIDKPRHRDRSLLLEGCRDLTISGEGAELIFHGLTQSMVFAGCSGVKIEGLTIDWGRLPFSQGRVLAAEPTRIQVAVDAEYPVTGGEPIQAFMEYDPKTRRPLRGGREGYECVKSIRLLRPQVLEVTLKRPVRVRKGMLLVLRHQVYRFNAFSFHDCRDVSLAGVTVYCCPGMGLVAGESYDFHLKDFRVMIRPGSGRLMSATADATHFNACGGRITIEDCLFEGMGDDATNVHSMFLRITEKPAPDTVVAVVRNRWLMPPRVGERMEWTSGKTLGVLGTGRVSRVVLDRQARTHRVTFEAPAPEGVAVGDLLGNASRCPRLRIRRCTVRSNRARGFLIQTRDAVVEDNRFENCSGAAMHITCDGGFWTEAIGTRDVIVRRNTIVDCNLGVAMTEGAINVFAHLPGWKHAPAGVHRGVTIEGNTIDRTDNSAIAVGAADGVTVTGNTIRNWGRRPTRKHGAAAVYIHRSRNVTVRDNALTPPADRKDAEAVHVGVGCEKASIRVSGTEVKAGD